MQAKKPLRVLVLIDNIGTGGAETLLGDLASYRDHAAIDLHVAHLDATTAPSERMVRNGLDPVCVPVSTLLSRRDHRRVAEHIAAVGPDLVHTHLGASDVLGGFAARRLGVPAVTTLHQAKWLDGGAKDNVKDGLVALARRLCHRRVIAVSEAARTAYLRFARERGSRVVTIPNGIRVPEIIGGGTGVRAELGIAPDAFVVTMLSAMRAGKGHEVAVQAARLARRELPDLRLLLVGGGAEFGAVSALVSSHEEFITLTGERSDVFSVLDASDLLIHPTHMDALPTVVMEAMATRVPVVATAVGGIPEMFSDGREGVLLPAPPRPDDLAAAIVSLAGDPALRARLATSARRRFEATFTLERWVSELRGLYDDVLAEAAPPGRRRRLLRRP